MIPIVTATIVVKTKYGAILRPRLFNVEVSSALVIPKIIELITRGIITILIKAKNKLPASATQGAIPKAISFGTKAKADGDSISPTIIPKNIPSKT
jgi:hypothetical protein